MNNTFIQILETISPIDIRKLIGEKGGEETALKDNHLVITVVEVLKNSATLLGFDFCSKNGLNYFYNGNYWQHVVDNEIKHLLRLVAKKIGLNKYTAEYYSFSESLLKQFSVSLSLLKNDNDDSIKINLLNGTFVFGDVLQLKDFDQADFITYQLPFKYNKDATAPLFEAFLNRVLPDKDCQNILAEYLGYVFTKGHKQEKCLLLHGSGANGKSVFFNIVSALLGKENLSNYSLRDLGNPNSRSQISNKLLNYSSEIDANISKDTFKQLVTGEPLQAKLLYKDVYTIDNYAKLMFNCNELPKDVEYNTAFFRRWLIIPFTQTIPIHEQDKNLSVKIIATELSGIFNWVILGLQRLIKQETFTESKAVDEALQEFKQDSDSVYQFINHFGYKPTEKCKSRLSMLYKDYTKFCLDNGFRSPNSANFSKRLALLGFDVKRQNYGNCVCMEKENIIGDWDNQDEDDDELPFG